MNAIKDQIVSLEEELTSSFPSGMSEEQSLAFWGGRQSAAIDLVHKIDGLKAMAEKGNEACAAVVELARERAAHWRLTNWLHDKGICVIL